MSDEFRPLAPPAPGARPGTGYPGAPGGTPPAKRPRAWLPWALGGCGCLVAAAIVTALIVVSVVLVSSRSPEQTVQDYHRAWDTADCDLFFETTTESFRSGASCADFTEAVETGGTGTIEVLSSETDGDRAIVITEEEATFEGVTIGGTVEYRLVKRDGDWLINENIHQ